MKLKGFDIKKIKKDSKKVDSELRLLALEKIISRAKIKSKLGWSGFTINEFLQESIEEISEKYQNKGLYLDSKDLDIILKKLKKYGFKTEIAVRKDGVFFSVSW